MEQIDEQPFDVRTIHVLIRHNHHASIPQLLQVLVRLAVLQAQNPLDACELVIVGLLVHRSILNVQNLAFERKYAVAFAPHDLETGDGYCLTNNSKDQLNREFSYPSLCQTPDGALHIAYTYWRQAIKYVRVAPDWALGYGA